MEPREDGRKANRSSRRVVKTTPAEAPRKRREGGVMVRANYQDDEGRMWATMVPLGHEEEASMGIPIGPPDLSPLGLPPAQEVRLHNQLFNRGILTSKDLRGRGKDVFAAIQSALQVDVAAVTGLYR